MNRMKRFTALMLPLMLAACLLSPGQFTSGLDVQDNGDFTFRYQGELIVTDLSPATAGVSEFEPYGCYDDETYKDRACTEAEIAEQRAEFDAMAQQQDLAQAGMTTGMPGIPDLQSEEGISEFIAMLSKQKGWEKLAYRGDGIFDVEYVISGNLSHGFAFPLVDNMPGIFTFISAIPRKDGSIKISAPAFTNNNGLNGQMGSMGAALMVTDPPASDASQSGRPKAATGTFTLRTSGEILTNNTEEGPASISDMSVLVWTVTERSNVVPEALIRLKR